MLLFSASAARLPCMKYSKSMWKWICWSEVSAFPWPDPGGAATKKDPDIAYQLDD